MGQASRRPGGPVAGATPGRTLSLADKDPSKRACEPPIAYAHACVRPGSRAARRPSNRAGGQAPGRAAGRPNGQPSEWPASRASIPACGRGAGKRNNPPAGRPGYCPAGLQAACPSAYIPSRPLAWAPVGRLTARPPAHKRAARQEPYPSVPPLPNPRHHTLEGTVGAPPASPVCVAVGGRRISPRALPRRSPPHFAGYAM